MRDGGLAAYRREVREFGEASPFRLLLPGALWLMDSLRLPRRWPRLYGALHYRMSSLHGSRTAAAYTRVFMAEMLAAECAVLVFFLLLIVLSGADAGLFMMGGFMLVFVPLLLVRDADRKVQQRKRAILMELPLLLNRLILLVNAGETVQQALIRIVESGEEQTADSGADKPEKAGPLQSELASAVKKMQNRVSFSRAMDELNRNCGVQEVSVFVNALLLNYKRGGRELVSALSAMSHQMWEARKNAAKTLGEEASSKLVFPMVVIFLVVLVVVGTPAILWMK